MNDFLSFVSDISFISVLLAGIIFIDEEKKGRVGKLFYNKGFIVSTIIVIFFSVFVLNIEKNEKNEKLKRATKQAFVGFIIALMAYLELVVAPFFIILITSYYLNI